MWKLLSENHKNFAKAQNLLLLGWLSGSRDCHTHQEKQQQG